MMPTEYFLAHIWLIPLFPLAGAALMLFIGKRLPNAGVNVVCVGSVFLSMCFAFGAIWQLIARPASERLVAYNLFRLGSGRRDAHQRGRVHEISTCRGAC